MKKSWVFVLFFLLPSHNEAMKQMDLETLLVGIKHHDAHFQSAQGSLELWNYDSDYNKKTNPLAADEVSGEGKWEIVFALTSNPLRIRCDTRSEIFPNLVRIWDGEKQIDVDYAGVTPEIAVRGNMIIEDECIPWYWETYNSRTSEGVSRLGQYLEQFQCQLIGQEEFQDVMCYVVSTEVTATTTEKFWIAPSQGYRLLKFEAITRFGDAPARMVGLTDYQQYKGEVWFPKSGTVSFYVWDEVLEKEQLWGKVTMELKTVQVNINVSEQFNLNLPPESEVWDHRTKSIRTLKEVWP